MVSGETAGSPVYLFQILVQDDMANTAEATE